MWEFIAGALVSGIIIKKVLSKIPIRIEVEREFVHPEVPGLPPEALRDSLIARAKTAKALAQLPHERGALLELDPSVYSPAFLDFVRDFREAVGNDALEEMEIDLPETIFPEDVVIGVFSGTPSLDDLLSVADQVGIFLHFTEDLIVVTNTEPIVFPDTAGRTLTHFGLLRNGAVVASWPFETPPTIREDSFAGLEVGGLQFISIG